jgi:hypothetical protein
MLVDKGLVSRLRVETAAGKPGATENGNEPQRHFLAQSTWMKVIYLASRAGADLFTMDLAAETFDARIKTLTGDRST